MKLPKIFEYFRSGHILTIEEARQTLNTSGNTLRKRLSELASKGYLSPIRQGLYRVISPKDDYIKNATSPFAIAAKLTPSCYVAFSTALQLHAGETPQESDTVFVVSPTKFNSFCFAGRKYFWCQNPDNFGIEEVSLRDECGEFKVRTSSFEKAIFDCLRRTAHSPSLPDLISLCKRVSTAPNLKLVLEYADVLGVSAIFNRIGLFFELMQPHWDIPGEVIFSIEKKISRKQTEWTLAMGIDPALKSKWKIQFSSEFHSISEIPSHKMRGATVGNA